MEWSQEWETAHAAVFLTFAVAVLSVVVGLLHISGVRVSGPLAPYVPDFVRRIVGFTGTVTGFGLLGATYALRRGYRLGWDATVVLLPLAALQGLLQVSVFSLPLVALSALCVPLLVYHRRRFSRRVRPSPTQFAAATALATALLYGTVGSYALREEFTGITTIVDAFYFTVVTASTVGYGDVTPATGIGRMFGLSVLLLNVSAFAVALGVLLTPAIEAQLSKALGRMTDRQFDLLSDHVIVLGYGDLTESILEELTDRASFAVITADEARSRALADRDVPVMTADPSDEAPQRRAGIEDALAVVAATDDDAQDALGILTARQLNPDVRIIAAATQRENVNKLRRAGADVVISPATIGGRLLAESALGDEDAEGLAADLAGEPREPASEAAAEAVEGVPDDAVDADEERSD